ncbi:MAG: T9SS type A sorting domain-containing protein [bacterium]
MSIKNKPLFVFLFTVICFNLGVSIVSAQDKELKLPGFVKSPYFNEQICTFNYEPEIRIHINAPSSSSFDPFKPVGIMLFALPNGNSIEWTVGKLLNTGDDWHYDIQHIGAQTRFLRQSVTDYNLVTVYLETVQKSWPSWRSKYSATHTVIVKQLVEYIKNLFSSYNPFVVLSGHSGGGGFTFSFLDGVTEIPSYVKRISFLDSDYNYTDAYGPKLVNWLNAAPDNFLSVIAYNDSVALYNGQPIVSATGGTWYRSQMMKNFMTNYFTFTSQIDADFMKFTALNGRVKFILKQNPTQIILHTVQVEKNGCIQGMVSGTDREEQGYVYFGNRAYTNYIQSATVYPAPLTIPPRPVDAVIGSVFMQSVTNLTFEQRETKIYDELVKGNIPDFYRDLTTIESSFQDAGGTAHVLKYQVMPDYIAIGSNADFCRIPTGPITAQKIADFYGAIMPTRKLVDNIYQKCLIKLEPVTYAPVGNQNELVPKFIEHNTAIEQQRITAGGLLGNLTGGTKKDVVLSNLIIDPTRPDHVVIYGWHTLAGTPIQPLTNIHINSYVDYSHGIRFINNEAMLDGNLVKIKNLLMDATLYKVVSDESAAMVQPTYLSVAGVPAAPKSFGVLPNSNNGLKIVIKQDPTVNNYKVYLSNDGINFPDYVVLQPDNMVINDLIPNLVYYVKIKAVNDYGESLISEMLAAIPNSGFYETIVINGFDRGTTGNTRNFIMQHAAALKQNSVLFCSATNDAITDGIVLLTDYNSAFYILGEESTADETFSSSEQIKVADFLKQGGKLFVSGSEIAWDLDYKGTASDKSFINNYLKSTYKNDAPFGTSGVYYSVIGLSNTFDNISFNFDNGTNGTYNVLWPDVFGLYGGGSGAFKYTALDTTAGYAGVKYSGIFPSGTLPGKVVVLGYPFETVVTQEKRFELMKKVVLFFEIPTSPVEDNRNDYNFTYNLLQNYPNPFNPTTIISFTLPKSDFVKLELYNTLGQKVKSLLDENLESGLHKIEFNANNLASGIYFYKLVTSNYTETKKMILQK